MPFLTVIAGPNGSGKSTLTEWADLQRQGILIDPDAVAREINPQAPSKAAIQAGREILSRVTACVSRKQSFAIETTLSSNSILHLIKTAKRSGYQVHLVFVALDRAERCIARVRTRSAQGGHFIPDSDVRRRYARSLAALQKALAMVDVARVYDNSGDAHKLILAMDQGRITQASEIPPWLPL